MGGVDIIISGGSGGCIIGIVGISTSKCTVILCSNWKINRCKEIVLTKIVSLVYFDLRELPISIPAWLGTRSDVLGWDRYDINQTFWDRKDRTLWDRYDMTLGWS
jgi:hypothetical protein